MILPIKATPSLVAALLWLCQPAPRASWAAGPQRDEPKYVLQARAPVAFSTDGKFVATGGHGGDGTVTVWDVATAKPLHSLGRKQPEGSWSEAGMIEFSPDGATLATVILDYPELSDTISGGMARRWDWRKESIRSEFPVTPVERSLAAFSPDVQTLAISTEHGDVVLYDAHSGKARATLRPSRRPGLAPDVYQLAFSPDGKSLATMMADVDADERVSNFAVRIWDTQRSHVRSEFALDSEDCDCLTWSPDGRLVALGMAGRCVELRDRATGRVKARLEVLGKPGGGLEALHFSPDGQTLAGGMVGNKVVLWDIATRKVKMRLGYNSRFVRFSPDSKLLAEGTFGRTSGDCEECVSVWDVSQR